MQRDGENFFEAEGVGERLEDEDETGSRAIRIGDDETGIIAAIFLLGGNGVEMRGVDLRNKQRDVGIHAVIFGVADDGIAGAGEIFFGGSGDAGIERGENEIAVEARVETLYDEVARGFRDGTVEMPADGFGVTFAGRALGGGNFGELKPGMSGKKFHQALAYQTCCAQNTGTPFF